jgi:hypothetical protein
MHALRASYLRILSLVSCLAFFLLLVPALTQATDQPATQSTTKSKASKAKPATTVAPKAAKKKAAPKETVPVVTLTEDEALASFDTFTIDWMEKLRQTEEFQRTERMKVAESSEGFSAEYNGYLSHRYIVVKKTTSKDTPFVGILTYYQQTLRCVGKTREEAVRGPFQQAGTSQVSEIFRFTKGKWHY